MKNIFTNKEEAMIEYRDLFMKYCVNFLKDKEEYFIDTVLKVRFKNLINFIFLDDKSTIEEARNDIKNVIARIEKEVKLGIYDKYILNLGE